MMNRHGKRRGHKTKGVDMSEVVTRACRQCSGLFSTYAGSSKEFCRMDCESEFHGEVSMFEDGVVV